MPCTCLTAQASRDQRMKGIYESYMHGLRGANVSLVMHYSSVTTYSQYGSWGLMEWMDQDPNTAPKLQVGVRLWGKVSIYWGVGSACPKCGPSGMQCSAGLSGCPAQGSWALLGHFRESRNSRSCGAWLASSPGFYSAR
jgi:hypothetical protein